MKRTQSCSVDNWAVGRLSFPDTAFRRQRVRKRRYPLPRETRGRDLNLLFSFGTDQRATSELPKSFEAEPDELQRFVRRVLWVCIVILGLILFGGCLAHFIQEAPFAWPSINGRF